MGWLADFVDSVAAMLIDELAGDIRMFPDGNASVARLRVQKMIPQVAPGMKGVEDVAITRFDYGALDLTDQAVRIRLNSTAVGVKEVGDKVQVNYVQHGKACRVTASHCVLACYNNLIPHLCPEMSDAQKEGLGYGERMPFVYANVLLENGEAFSQLGLSITQCPYDPFQWVSAAPTMTTGGYEPPRPPMEPREQLVIFCEWDATKFTPLHSMTTSNKSVNNFNGCLAGMVSTMKQASRRLRLTGSLMATPTGTRGWMTQSGRRDKPPMKSVANSLDVFRLRNPILRSRL